MKNRGCKTNHTLPIIAFIVFCLLFVIGSWLIYETDENPRVQQRQHAQLSEEQSNFLDGCGPHGSSRQGSLEWSLNVFKNREAIVSRPRPEITLEQILSPGDDLNRFRNWDYGSVVGYVAEVKRGSIETCNCKAPDAEHQDTHIALVPTPEDAENRHRRVIVEVTPRSRLSHPEWATSTLREKIYHHTVKVSGWMFADTEHTENAIHTNPDGRQIWRATVWEIHPICEIQVLD